MTIYSMYGLKTIPTPTLGMDLMVLGYSSLVISALGLRMHLMVSIDFFSNPLTSGLLLQSDKSGYNSLNKAYFKDDLKRDC